jgi:chromosome segregation ATPase
LTEELNT